MGLNQTALSLLLFVSFPGVAQAAPAQCVPGRQVCGQPLDKICVAQNNPAMGFHGAGDPVSCLLERAGKVCSVLTKLSEKFGRIYVVSADRSRNNASRSGAKNSMHLYCRATDVVFEGRQSRSKQTQMVSYLRSLQQGPGMRYNVYCSGRTHVDNSQNLPNSYSSCVEHKNWASGGTARFYGRDPSRIRRQRG